MEKAVELHGNLIVILNPIANINNCWTSVLVSSTWSTHTHWTHCGTKWCRVNGDGSVWKHKATLEGKLQSSDTIVGDIQWLQCTYPTVCILLCKCIPKAPVNMQRLHSFQAGKIIRKLDTQCFNWEYQRTKEHCGRESDKRLIAGSVANVQWVHRHVRKKCSFCTLTW